MPNEGPKLVVTENRKIMKYHDGDVPGVDEPFEIVQEEVVHTGEAAIKILAQYGQGGN